MKSRWPAIYYDGKTAARHAVTVILTPTGLRLDHGDGRTTLWLYEELRQAQGAYKGEQVRFERGPEPQAIVIEDREILEAIAERAPKKTTTTGTHGGARLVRAALGALVGLVVGGWGMYTYGLPALARAVAARVPVRWEAALGAEVRDEVAPENQRDKDPARLAAVQAVVDRLLSVEGPSDYHYEVVISSSSAFNAFAAPGGYIIVNRGLLAQTTRPEQLAGVLAHEITHVEKRHTTRAICEEMSSRALVTLMLGNGDGFGTVVNAARTLGELGHGRQTEDEADRLGMLRLIDARIDPKGMLEMFEVMKGESPEVYEVLSDHPDTAARLARLKLLAAKAHGPWQPIAVGEPWAKVAGTKPKASHP